jgi:hypothetical protein
MGLDALIIRGAHKITSVTQKDEKINRKTESDNLHSPEERELKLKPPSRSRGTML